MQEVKKFNDLSVSETYEVIGYSGPYNSKYGISYILKISDIKSSVTMEIWSTNLLAKYICNVCPNSKFAFTVSERDNKKYPVINGYNKQREYKMLQ